MYCEKCGTQLDKNKCPKCGFEKFHNPIPVAVGLVPVIKDGKTYLLGVRRNIEPQKGHIALPGGFQEIEDIKLTLVREIKEECDFDVMVDDNIDPLVYSSEPIPNRLLVFFTTKPYSFNRVNWDFKNEETQELCLISEDTKLAFPLHEKAVKAFFKRG